MAQAAEFHYDCILQNCRSQQSWLWQNSINTVLPSDCHCFLFVPHFIGFLRNVLWLAVAQVSLMHTENTRGLRSKLQTQHSFYHMEFLASWQIFTLFWALFGFHHLLRGKLCSSAAKCSPRFSTLSSVSAVGKCRAMWSSSENWTCVQVNNKHPGYSRTRDEQNHSQLSRLHYESSHLSSSLLLEMET